MLKHKDLIEYNKDPFVLFKKWYDLACETEINDPNAMTLSTISKNQPSSRVVLLKSYDANGLVFYTNSNSKKGKSIKENNNVALNFHWKTQNRQISIEGHANIVSGEVADNYFKTRSRGSQIGAWSSKQSDDLLTRNELIEQIIVFENKYKDQDIPRPSHWNGYLVNPRSIEFWQEMPFRVHDRVLYHKTGNSWNIKKLYP